MLGSILKTVLSAAAVVSACTPPTEPLSNNITEGFGIQVQNASVPIIHNRYINLWSAGGGDQHLYLSPAGDSAFNLTLVNGVLSRGIIHAVINGEYTADDNTTKMFMTERGDPKAFFQPVYGCNPDTDAVQVELDFVSRAAVPGGFICFRSASGERHEARYSPPGNTVIRADRPCYEVTLAVVPAPTA
ncbi:hypothetical protein HER10_EVM0005870 [Colletotrichum scovillei]|uniref:Carbohydrate-binding WSC domain protein n=1 Tax=Colletotrichum scovillei TaxID=1209932 RepID=A0A9P7UMS6_9PEZI|nr:uncharacterized protein HER10_EVM0005870 [Colletotrichum scovillei]KAF4777691.1 hypothetical protein HER10_EVM0005870 [Colletotrichum scovillei]KAG7059516.1 carbohydrate-binding WSC domain protein [Colletotrichum scovillei]KAG7078124.1 carbohydrate-binding WSC domain protein [Colletotrichum scovillei]KAG7085107.1 carbohydrate-binding WSC domain protein [Colletotrichum scovillei]